MTFSVIMVWSCMTPLFACINTTYSRTDEIEITNDLAHLIIGAFAHHGTAFYQHEAGRCQAILQKNPNDFDARNDLAAAYTKLKQWKMAQTAFDENELRHPGQYKTASNLGVMYKKQGDFAKAERWIDKALTIKPGGHMGLGDYYLRMIKWNKSLKDGNQKPIKNFLGVGYDAGAAASAVAANRQHVITLIKNDIGFADAYVVLGDILYVEENYQLALRAYYRASYLTHPNGRAVRRRQKNIIEMWRREMKPGYVLEDRWQRQLDEEVNAADHWLTSYKAIEASRLRKGESVGFAEMKRVMSGSHPKPKIVEAVYYPGEKIDEKDSDEVATVGAAIVFLGIFGVVIFLIRKRVRIKRQEGKFAPEKPRDGPQYDSRLFGP